MNNEQLSCLSDLRNAFFAHLFLYLYMLAPCFLFFCATATAAVADDAALVVVFN